MYRKSPLKSENLQTHISNENRKELKLILDCKTRWSSLLKMLERFLQLRTCVQKSLIDLKSDVTFDTYEFENISEIIDALKPLATTLEALCRKDANLVMADAAIKFAFDKIEESAGPTSVLLKQALLKRIKERRTEMSTVLLFLHSGSLDNSNSGLFDPISKNIVAKIVKELILRLYEPNTEERAESTIILTESVVPQKKSKRSELQSELDSIIETDRKSVV